jgi:phenylacetate-CoA ligase
MFDPEAETMPREALSALQTRRLKQTLERAYRDVAHYRKKWDGAGIGPQAFKSLADLARFPFTAKSDLRDNYPFGMFAVPGKDLRRLHASSGTTGKPTVVGYTREDLECWSDLMARSLACAGALPGDIVHNAYGYGLFTGGLGAHYGAERLGCAVVPVSGGATERQVTLLQDFGATVLCARWTYTACPKSWDRALRASATWPRRDCMAGKIISCSRSSTPRACNRWLRVKRGSSSSPP